MQMRTVAGQPWVLWALGLFFLGLGFTARFDIPLAVLAIAAMFAFSGNEQQLSRIPLREHWSLLFFLLAAGLATAFSVDRKHSLGVQPQLLPALLSYAVIVSFANTLSSLRFVGLALLFSGLLTAILIMVADSASQEDPLTRVVMMGNALLIVPNDVLMLSVIAPLAICGTWSRGWVWRTLAGFYLIMALGVCAMVQSRQAVLLLVVGPVITAGLMRPRWSVPLLLVGLAVALAIDAMLGWPLAHKILMFPRIYVWHSAWVMFLDSPWVGKGPGMFNALYFTYLERAGYVLEQLDDRRTMPWAHSLYLEQLAERGIPGFLALLALLGSALRRTARYWKQAGADEDRRLLASGLLAALIVLMLAGIAEASLIRLWVMVCLLVLVAFSIALTRCGICEPGHKAGVVEC